MSHSPEATERFKFTYENEEGFERSFVGNDEEYNRHIRRTLSFLRHVSREPALPEETSTQK